MNYKHMCIVDAQNMFVDFVVAYANEDSSEFFIPERELEDGERLLEIPHPCEMVKPHWTGDAREEYATPEEVEERNGQRRKEESIWGESFDPGPTQDQRLAVLEQQTTDTQLALAESYEQSEQQNADLMLATAELYESMLALQRRIEILEGGVHNG